MSCELQPITFKPFTRTEEKCAVVDCQYKTVQVITTGDAAGVQTVEIYDGATLLPADTELFICKEPIPTVPACDTSVETNILHEGETTFIRTTTYDVAGNITSTTDTLLDGTAYTVVSPANVEAGPAIVEPEYEYFAFVYNANGDLTSVSRRDVVTLQVWIKTLTYIGSNLSTVSAWVLQ